MPRPHPPHGLDAAVPAVAPSGDSAPSADLLVPVVERLRAERDGLRDAMRSRALIEQAKGVLMVRHRVTADEAFARLRRESQHSNVRLAELAARVVAEAGRPPAGLPTVGFTAVKEAQPASDSGRPEPRPPAAAEGAPGLTLEGPAGDPSRVPGDPDRSPDPTTQIRHLLAGARLDAAAGHDEIVAALAEIPVAWPRPTSVVLVLCDPDGALRTAGYRGFSGELASQWVRIPPQVDVPLTRATRHRELVWLADQTEIARRFPVLLEMAPHVVSCASVPLSYDGTLLGAIGFTWRGPLHADADRRSYLVAVADGVAHAIRRLDTNAGVGGSGSALSWLQPILDGSLTAAALLRPVRRAGRVVDFLVEQANPAAGSLGTGSGKLSGASLLTVLPDAGARALLPLCRDVLADGLPRQLDDVRLAGSPGSTLDGYLTVRAARLSDRVLATWRLRSSAEVLYDDLLAAGRTARVASFRWNLLTGELRGSPNLSALLGWRSGTPLTPETVGRAFDPVQWSALRSAAVATLRTGVPLEMTLPVARRRRWVRVVGERLAHGGGRPLALYGSIQDLTHLWSLQPRPSRPPKSAVGA